MAVIFRAQSLPGETERLTGVAPGDETDRSALISNSVWFAPLERSPLHGRGVGSNPPVVPYSLLRTRDPFPDIVTP